MPGIIAYGGYLPLHRLGPGTVGWKGSGEKAVGCYDEDSITMATAAAIDCLAGSDRKKVDGLYFASTTPPYVEKLCSALISTATDLRRDIYVADIGHSLRSATIALRAALDAVNAGSLGQALVVAADQRLAQPGSDLEASVGDGAAAVLVGRSDVSVEIEDTYSIADELLDAWRLDGDRYVRMAEDRFGLDQGYFRILPDVVSAVLTKCNLQPAELTRVVLNGLAPRRIQEVASRMGFDARSQLQDGLYSWIGNTGAASAMLTLIHALEQAKPGDRILLANYGNGADAVLMRVTEGIRAIQGRTRLPTFVASKKPVSDYATYLRWRGILPASGPKRPPQKMPSPQALKREEMAVLRLYARKCQECGKIQFPPQRVCSVCQTKDHWVEDVRLSDKRATLFTYSIDYLQPIPEPPMVVCALNFDGGGRMMAEMTDRDVNAVKIGMPLEMSFRKLASVDGVNNYYWKCVPVRGE